MSEKLNDNESLSDLAYRFIKENILNLTYAPGDSVTEAGVAKDLQISRMPIRIALKRLENEDWLDSDYRKKVRVKKISKKDIIEIYQIREFFELSAIKMIFEQGLEKEYSYRIEEKLVRMRAAASNYYNWEKADIQLHMEIISIFNNERINKIYTDSLDKIIYIGMLSKKGEPHIKFINEELSLFVEALRNGDMDQAIYILKKDHLDAGKQMAINSIE